MDARVNLCPFDRAVTAKSGVNRNDITCNVLQMITPSFFTRSFRPSTTWAEGGENSCEYHLSLPRAPEPARCQPCRDVGKFSDLDSIIPMEVQSPSSSNATDKGENQKQAACLNCRRSKTRCLRDAGHLKCKKCAQTQAECIVPEYRVGRKKGIKK
jgi:hypothetical protein